MLTGNYILYYTDILIGIIAFLMIGHEICAELFGLLRYERTFFSRVLSAFLLMGILVVMYVWIVFPMLQDIPEYISKNYSVAEGRVVRVWAGLEQGTSVRGEVEIIEESTGEKIKFRNIYVPYMQKDTQVKVAYLDHCKIGSFMEVNGTSIVDGQHSGKMFCGILIVFINCSMPWFIIHTLKKWEGPDKKKYGVFVYKNIYGILLFLMQFAIYLGTIILVRAICGIYNSLMVIEWSCLLLVYLTLTLVLFTMRLQKIVIDGEVLLYCNFKKKYKGTIKDIVKMELVEKKSFLAKEEQKKSVQLLITMADGTILVVNDMETASNQKFYEKLKNEALIKM